MMSETEHLKYAVAQLALLNTSIRSTTEHLRSAGYDFEAEWLERDVRPQLLRILEEMEDEIERRH